MEAILKPVTPEIRTAHLDLLANGEKVLKTEKNKHLPLLISCIAAITIGTIIIYYESKLRRSRKPH